MSERDDKQYKFGAIVLMLLLMTWIALIGITAIQSADIRDLQRRVGQLEVRDQ